jgi:pSer/pThr/pTyr-binding forkhead associated (FHA) protein
MNVSDNSATSSLSHASDARHGVMTRIVLEVMAGPDAGRILEAGSASTIGREGSIRLQDGKTSRIHACVAPEDGRWTLSDMRSRHGCRLNGQKIDGAAALQTGDRVQLGRNLMVVREAAVTEPGAAPASHETAAGPSLTLDVFGPRDGDHRKLVGSLRLNEACDLGRGSPAVFLNDTALSRRHARVRPDQGNWVIEDIGSTHGTWVNNKRAQGRVRLLEGDRIRLGRLKMIVTHAMIEAAPGRIEEPAPDEPLAVEQSALAQAAVESTSADEPVPVPADDASDETFPMSSSADHAPPEFAEEPLPDEPAPAVAVDESSLDDPPPLNPLPPRADDSSASDDGGMPEDQTAREDEDAPRPDEAAPVPLAAEAPAGSAEFADEAVPRDEPGYHDAAVIDESDDDAPGAAEVQEAQRSGVMEPCVAPDNVSEPHEDCGLVCDTMPEDASRKDGNGLGAAMGDDPLATESDDMGDPLTDDHRPTAEARDDQATPSEPAPPVARDEAAPEPSAAADEGSGHEDPIAARENERDAPFAPAPPSTQGLIGAEHVPQPVEARTAADVDHDSTDGPRTSGPHTAKRNGFHKAPPADRRNVDKYRDPLAANLNAVFPDDRGASNRRRTGLLGLLKRSH